MQLRPLINAFFNLCSSQWGAFISVLSRGASPSQTREPSLAFHSLHFLICFSLSAFSHLLLSVLSPQHWQPAISGFKSLHQHQPKHQHQIGTDLPSPGPRHPLGLPSAAAAAAAATAAAVAPGAGALPRRQPEQLQQLLRRQRPRGPAQRLPLARGAGPAARRRGPGEPLGKTNEDGHVGDINPPCRPRSFAFSKRTVLTYLNL